MKGTAWCAALLAGVALAGCGGDSTSPVGPADDELAGRTYDLETVNGEELPYLYPNTTHTTLWGQIVFDPVTASWQMTSEHCRVLPCEGANIQGQQVSGTYTRNGNVINFRETQPGSLRFEGLIQDEGQRVLVDLVHPELGPSARVYVDNG